MVRLPVSYRSGKQINNQFPEISSNKHESTYGSKDACQRGFDWKVGIDKLYQHILSHKEIKGINMIFRLI